MAGKLVQALMGLLVSLGWIMWLSVIIFTSPDTLASRFLFFASFFLALVATFWLLLYWLSFRIYSSKRFQGNLGRSLLQGIPPSLMLVAALWLRSLRVFNLIIGIVLVVLMLAAEYALLPRTRGPQRAE